MFLYEITNGFTGECYCRVYAWAADEQAALTLAREALRAEARTVPRGYEPAYWENLRIRRLFAASDGPFATRPSDSGFDDAGL